MTQEEFHRIYEEMPEKFRAELIGGTVYVAEPLFRPHGKNVAQLSAILQVYAGKTPGLEVCDNTTVILGNKDEVQPDIFLRISPEWNGQSRDKMISGKGPYVVGAPELVAEVAFSSRAIDLHLKRKRYQASGVLEYVVLCLKPKEIVWFDLRNRTKLKADECGVFRSIIFPGLWVDRDALLSLDFEPAMLTLTEGISSPEHADFVAKLAADRG